MTRILHENKMIRKRDLDCQRSVYHLALRGGTGDDDDAFAAGKTLPNTLQSLMTSKIDKLSPSRQWVLKVASVIGESGITEHMLRFLLLTEPTTNTGTERSTDVDAISQDIRYLHRRGILSLERPFSEEPSTQAAAAAYTCTASIRVRSIHT